MPGRRGQVRRIANAEKINETYVGRVLRLTQRRRLFAPPHPQTAAAGGALLHFRLRQISRGKAEVPRGNAAMMRLHVIVACRTIWLDGHRA
jgi:hypothetical protein